MFTVTWTQSASRSLLYLVSRSFEQGLVTPILGLERDFSEKIRKLNLPNVQFWSAPGNETKSTTHGGFDDDATTMASVIRFIQRKSCLEGGIMF